MGVAVEQLEVAGQLLDAVDLAAPLDLDRNRRSAVVAGQDVDRADRGGVLPAYQPPAVAEGLDVFGEQRLQVGLDPVLDEARVEAELVAGVVEQLLDGDDQLLAALVRHGPDVLASRPVTG